MNYYESKKQQKKDTLEYIDKMIKPYANYINIHELDSLLKPLGLYIDFEETWIYYNTLNDMNFLDTDLHINCIKSKKRWCCIDTDFYKNEVVYKTEKYNTLKEIRNNYYSIYKDSLAQI